uniref:Asparagine--tRNA ligase N-terminal domain-containing protein n=1 Tax=Aotus nancymaae TaxID=37293 RepID=A0A2K5DXM3_AOTNA
MVPAELYVSEREGDDATGDGTKEKPFKTGLKALMTVGKEPFPTIYVDSQKENERWDVISKSQMKSIKKMWHREQMKSDSQDKKENLEEAKKITIKNDPSLPEPKRVKINVTSLIGDTVKLLLQH